uniref:Uncharacterized protein n=1 Tax=Vespula pensylvanica TaxID=30213 RepID=A0A834JZ40_VESPE|nr:hypothetical protein H0235_016357 [Vespula pensylvanica]
MRSMYETRYCYGMINIAAYPCRNVGDTSAPIRSYSLQEQNDDEERTRLRCDVIRYCELRMRKDVSLITATKHFSKSLCAIQQKQKLCPITTTSTSTSTSTTITTSTFSPVTVANNDRNAKPTLIPIISIRAAIPERS